MQGREKARVLGGPCVLVVGPRQHVHGVLVAGDAPHHPCDAHDVSLVAPLLLTAGVSSGRWCTWLVAVVGWLHSQPVGGNGQRREG